jgi:hypothetical protein
VTTKSCSRCNKILSLDLFRQDARYSDGYTCWCQICYRENNKIHYINKKKWKDIEKRYGIPKEKYKKMEEEQKGLCACCGKEPKNRGKNGSFVVDHCHATGAVRGLLCAKCNAGIGFFDDDPALLLLASQYLKSHDNFSCQRSSGKSLGTQRIST